MIPVTRVDPPAPGKVRLKPDFGSVVFLQLRGLDLAQMSAQVGDKFCGVSIGAASNGDGPGDFDAVEIAKMLRLFADKIEGLVAC